ncbi:MAG: DUF4292 domain-containing protein [Bacteroidia bacterium]|nr:DUF4292 domain-containing protein [Bacteroidia bacterium]
MNKPRLKPYSSIAFILLIFSTGMLSCKSTSKIKKTVDKEIILKRDSLKSQELLEQVHSVFAAPEWFNCKSNAKVVNSGKTTSFNVNMRYRRSEAIWISFSPLLGIEVARVLITSDSVKIMDRHNKKYWLGDYQVLQETFNLDLSFEQIEAVLLGNLYEYVKENKYKSIYMDNEIYVLSTLGRRKIIKTLKEKEPHKNVIQDVWIDPETNRIVATDIIDDKMERSLHIKYSKLLKTDAGVIPQQVDFELLISDTKDLNVSLSHTKFEVNEEKSFPFKIPESYEAMR